MTLYATEKAAFAAIAERITYVQRFGPTNETHRVLAVVGEGYKVMVVPNDRPPRLPFYL